MLDLRHGDCREVLRTIPDNSIDACVTDPPYELAFMGKHWDGTGIAYQVDLWAEVLRVLKPGGHLLAFGGTRTHHRMVCAIEDAGFEIRDEMQWIYGSGFPKSHNLKGQWEGWGTALKPAHEPICVARKPLCGTVAANVLEHGTGGINVDGCRVRTTDNLGGGAEKAETVCSTNHEGWDRPWKHNNEARAAHAERVRANVAKAESIGRWPANVLLTHAPGCECTGTKRVKGHAGYPNGPGGNRNRGVPIAAENDEWANTPHTGHADADGLETVEAWQCVDGCPVKLMDEQSGDCGGSPGIRHNKTKGPLRAHGMYTGKEFTVGHADTGGASRFFYCAKASRKDRGAGNVHPTVKPVKLMRYLVRLVTPPGGVVLDPFLGSGTTGVAARAEGFRFLGIEQSADYLEIAKRRTAGEGLFAEAANA